MAPFFPTMCWEMPRPQSTSGSRLQPWKLMVSRSHYSWSAFTCLCLATLLISMVNWWLILALTILAVNGLMVLLVIHTCMPTLGCICSLPLANTCTYDLSMVSRSSKLMSWSLTLGLTIIVTYDLTIFMAYDLTIFTACDLGVMMLWGVAVLQYCNLQHHIWSS